MGEKKSEADVGCSRKERKAAVEEVPATQATVR